MVEGKFGKFEAGAVGELVRSPSVVRREARWRRGGCMSSSTDRESFLWNIPFIPNTSTVLALQEQSIHHQPILNPPRSLSLGDPIRKPPHQLAESRDIHQPTRSGILEMSPGDRSERRWGFGYRAPSNADKITLDLTCDPTSKRRRRILGKALFETERISRDPSLNSSVS